MFRAAASLFQVLSFLWRRRILSVVAWVFALIFGLDRLIYFLTEGEWFASVGMAPLWWQRVGAQCQLFGGFLLLGALLSRLLLGAVLHPAGADTKLRGALARLEFWRVRAPRLSWIAALGWALLWADRLAAHWSDWLLFRANVTPHAPRGAGGWNALYLHFLPIFEPFWGALWGFSLGLFVIAGAAGLLRALPVLAARERTSPPLLPRVLWRAGAALLLLRAVGYALQILDLGRGKPWRSGDVFFAAPLLLLGLLGCGVLLFRALRHAGRPTVYAPQKLKSSLWLGLSAALFAPAILNFLTAPLRALWPETPALRAQRSAATRAAWRLNFAAAPPLGTSPLAATSIEQAWPVWDENTLLQTRRGAAFQNQRLVAWQSATLNFEEKSWRAYMAGQGAAAATWNAAREADLTTQIAFERLDLGPQNSFSSAPLSAPSAFFGLEGRSLFSNAPVGVPMGSAVAKLMWAWRLRDVLLPLDGANFSHLLVFRGARERAEKLAPFWNASAAPHLAFDGPNPVWLLELCAVSDSFPGAMPSDEAELPGQNAASDAIEMRLDARSGAVSFYAPSPNASSPDASSPNASSRGASSPNASSPNASSPNASSPGAVMVDQVTPNAAPVPHDDLVFSWRRVFPGILQDFGALSPVLRSQQRASPAVLRAQASLQSSLSGQDAEVDAAQIGHDARGVLTRVMAISKTGWNSLEAPHGGIRPRVWRAGNGDFAARLALIDAEVAAVPRSSLGEVVSSGAPFSWPDPAAPGGAWIGRPYFAVVPDAPVPVPGHALQLWRVALTGATGERVGIGESLEAAARVFAPPPVASGEKRAETSLEQQALQSHEAMQDAVKRGDWEAFGREVKREKQLLQKLAARGRK